MMQLIVNTCILYIKENIKKCHILIIMNIVWFISLDLKITLNKQWLDLNIFPEAELSIATGHANSPSSNTFRVQIFVMQPLSITSVLCRGGLSLHGDLGWL